MNDNEINLVVGFKAWLENNRRELTELFFELLVTVPEPEMDLETFAYEVYLEQQL